MCVCQKNLLSATALANVVHLIAVGSSRQIFLSLGSASLLKQFAQEK